MNISTNRVCEECGSPLEVRAEGSTQGLYCTKCDWAVVTTGMPEIRRDTAIYEVFVTGGNFKDEQQVKVISEVSGENFLAARKLLQMPGKTVFRGRAAKVVEVRDALEKAGIHYKIEPMFKY